jgi:hypothetical protein
MNEYSIILDKERKLKYSNRSFMELEKRTGKSIVSIFTEAAQAKTGQEQQKKLMETFSTSQFLTDFVYCGLLHEGQLTYDQVIDLIPVKDYMAIMTLALEVLPAEFGLTGKTDKKKATLKAA